MGGLNTGIGRRYMGDRCNNWMGRIYRTILQKGIEIVYGIFTEISKGI